MMLDPIFYIFILSCQLSFHLVNIDSISIGSLLPGMCVSATTQFCLDGKTNTLLDFMPDAEF